MPMAWFNWSEPRTQVQPTHFWPIYQTVNVLWFMALNDYWKEKNLKQILAIILAFHTEP